MTAIYQNVSDFIFCRKIIESICINYNCNYTDVDIIFSEDITMPEYKDDSILLPMQDKLPKTFFSIISLYLANIKSICGVEIPNAERSSINRFVFLLLSDFFMASEKIEINDTLQTRLDQHHLVYFLIKNLVCPFEGVKIDNCRVIIGKSGHLDASKVVTEENFSIRENYNSSPFIFLNLDVERSSIRNAFLFYDAVSLICKNPSSTINALFADKILSAKMIGLVSMACKDSFEVANFFAVLSILCNSSHMESFAVDMASMKQNDIKEANLGDSSWWFLGLTEEMLTPARGPDWTVHKMWQPFLDNLQLKVENERRKRGLDELPLELLLRVQGDEFAIDGNKSLQYLLSSDRIW